MHHKHPIKAELQLKEKENKIQNLSGMPPLRLKLIELQKIGSQPKLQMKCYAIMLNFVGFIQVPRLREFWKRKLKSNYSLSKVVGHMTDQLYKFTMVKSAIEVLLTQVTYHTCIKIQLFEKKVILEFSYFFVKK